MAKKQETNTENQDIFIGKVVKIGNSLAMIIPKNNAEFECIVEGDLLKVWIKKTEKKESETNVKKEESNNR